MFCMQAEVTLHIPYIVDCVLHITFYHIPQQ